VLWLFADKFGIHRSSRSSSRPSAGDHRSAGRRSGVQGSKEAYLAIGTWVIAETLRLIVANIKSTERRLRVTVQAASELADRCPGPRGLLVGLDVGVIAIAITYLLLRSATNGLGAESYARQRPCRGKHRREPLRDQALQTYRRRRLRPGTGHRSRSTCCASAAALSASNWTAYLIFITVIGVMGTIEGRSSGRHLLRLARDRDKYGPWYFHRAGCLASS